MVRDSATYEWDLYFCLFYTVRFLDVRSIKNYTKMFLVYSFVTLLLLLLLLLNTCLGCNITLDFRLKMTSCACFFGSGLKAIFNWKIHISIFAKSLFSSRAEALLSKITENKGVSSTKSLAIENYTSNKLLIYIKNNNNGPSLEPLITRALTSDQLETYPFNETLCFSFLEGHIKDLVNY